MMRKNILINCRADSSSGLPWRVRWRRVPICLLLDEPFSNLDVTLRARLSLEVRDILKSQNATAILVTHDQEEAFAIADEIGVMHQGEIQQWDTAYNLYHKPANRFVADFIGEGVFVPGKILDPQPGGNRTGHSCRARLHIIAVPGAGCAAVVVAWTYSSVRMILCMMTPAPSGPPSCTKPSGEPISSTLCACPAAAPRCHSCPATIIIRSERKSVSGWKQITWWHSAGRSRLGVTAFPG